jgi:hypothetical protein
MGQWKASVVKGLTIATGAFLLGVLLAAPAAAQSRPLNTEDPETIGPGQMAVQAGFDYEHGTFFPASGLKGNLTRAGTFGLDFGVSSIAQIEFSGGVRDSLTITNQLAAPLASLLAVTGTQTTAAEDMMVGAKIRFASETASRPSMALRFATRLPNASATSGLGLDTTDFLVTTLLAKTVQSIRVVGNIGFGILGNPITGGPPADVLLYGVSVARAIRQGTEFVAELNGRANKTSGVVVPGTESHSMMRVGGRYTRGAVRVDSAVLIGVTSIDPSWGFTMGLTWVFHAFKVP